jgi:hypothetical protein
MDGSRVSLILGNLSRFEEYVLAASGSSLKMPNRPVPARPAEDYSLYISNVYGLSAGGGLAPAATTVNGSEIATS